jgi:hypothetical protein
MKKHELIVVLLLLMKSMGAYADSTMIINVSDIPANIQNCLVLAAEPEDRSLLQVALIQDCYNQLSDENQERVIQVLEHIEKNNFKSSPVMSL